MSQHLDAQPPLGRGDAHIAAHMFQPYRLTLARELRGRSKAQLADAVQKTPSAISQFETGRTKPDAQTLQKLALALEVQLGFFAKVGGTPLISTDNCYFRSLRSASQRDRRSLLAVGTILCDLVSLLEDHVDLPREQVTSVATSAGNADEIEQAAIEVRRKWGLGLGPIPAIIKLLENKGVIVTRIPAEREQVDAFSTCNNHRPIVFLVTGKNSRSRARFDAAHELGHLVLHADITAASPEAERQANRFASAFLLPRDTFLRECPNYLNWDHLYELKRRWRVSIAALVKRGFDLGRISEASYRRAFIHLNETGQRQGETRDEPEVEYPTTLKRALDTASREYPLSLLCDHLGIFERDLQEILTECDPRGEAPSTLPGAERTSAATGTSERTTGDVRTDRTTQGREGNIRSNNTFGPGSKTRVDREGWVSPVEGLE